VLSGSVAEPDLEEYFGVVRRVDAFAAAVARRRATDMQCGPGCDDCCRARLTVSPVEARAISAHLLELPKEVQVRLLERAQADGDATAHREDRCVMLEEDGRCAVYAARPLVCRTQGLPLRYPSGVIPLEAVMAKAAEADITWCPLNFPTAAPEAGDVLDAERVDAMLALVNRRWCEAEGRDPLERVDLDAAVLRVLPRAP
jgi:hypothetical protein